MTYTEDDIRSALHDFLVNTAQVPAVDLASGDTTIADLNIDSLSAVEMLWTVEQRFGVRMAGPERGLASLTIDQLVSQFTELLRATAAGATTDSAAEPATSASAPNGIAAS